MKKATLLLAIIIFSILLGKTGFAQSNAWIWAKSMGGIDMEQGKNVVVDAAGNIYVTGSYNGNSLILGNDTLLNYSATIDSNDIFIAKFDASGQVLWAKRAGGGRNDNVYSIALDESGNIYICGTYESNFISFGSIVLYRSSSLEMFIAKYDSDGNALWAKKAIGGAYKTASALTVDGYGDIYVTGTYNYSWLQIGTIYLYYDGGEDIFVAKFDNNGNVLWAKRAGGSYDDYATSISVDGNDKIYLAGYYNSPSISFGGSILSNTDPSGNSCDIFLFKLSSDGQQLWASGAGGTSNDFARTIATDSIGNTSVSGDYVSQTINFDTISISNTNYSFDLMVVRYDTDGNVLWAKGALGTNEDLGKNVVTDNMGNSYITGYFNSDTLTFDSISVENSGNFDLFLVKFDSLGKVKWAISEGGTRNEFGESIAIDNMGYVYITGAFYSNPLHFGNYTLANAGFSDVYLARLNAYSLGGINEFQENRQISVYPNPTSDHLTISVYEKSRLEIINMTGQIMGSYNNVFQEITINTSNLPKGVYILKAITRQGIVTKKFVKQ